MTSCPKCGGTEVDYNSARGETVCINCGTVLEESAMVEGLQFAEGSNGGLHLVGQFVPASGGRSFGTNFGSRESREQSISRGYGNIQKIADCLRLPSSHVEAAQRIYLMALQRNFTIGRNNYHVAFSCLYTVCRREKTPHMLIDFSDVLQSPVRALGQVFTKLLRLLHIQVPCVDPSLFMERYACQLSLGDKTHSVATTGVRLIQAMTRDWICAGRRPTGLCGAALLISSRYHGFHSDTTEIANIVRISSPTISKRLSEFKQTSTAQITIDEFESTDLTLLPILRGPPCYEEGLKKLTNLALMGSSKPVAIKDIKRSKHVKSKETHVETEPRKPTVNCITEGLPLDISTETLCNDAPTAGDISNIAAKMMHSITNSPLPPKATDTDKTAAEEIDPLAQLLGEVRESALSMGFDESTDYTVPLKSKRQPLDSETHFETIESISDISDGEIESCMLTEAERQAKELIWDELTKDIMPDVHRRAKERKRSTNSGESSADKKKRRSSKKELLPEASSAAESVRIALSGSSVGNRINDDALEALFL